MRDWQPKKFSVALRPKPLIGTKSGICDALFGIYKRRKGSWGITHLGTGRGVCCVESCADARDIVAALEALPVNWETFTGPDSFDESKRKLVMEVLSGESPPRSRRDSVRN